MRFQGAIQKVPHSRSGREVHEKNDEKLHREWAYSQKSDVTHAKFSCAHFFFGTQFSLLLISLIGSNNITVSNNNKHPKSYF